MKERFLIRAKNLSFCNRNNSRHVSMCFKDPCVSIVTVNDVSIKFRNKLIEVSGVGPYGLAIISFFMSRGAGKKYDEDTPHLHWLVYHTRPRTSGQSLKNLPGSVMEELKAYWKELAGGTLEIKPVFKPAGLIDYFYGPRNVWLPEQNGFRMPIYNEGLLLRKASKGKLHVGQC